MGELVPASVQHGSPSIPLAGSYTQPLGAPQPPNEPHAISVSLPTWEAVTAVMAGADWAISQLQTSYPRFDVHNRVKELHDAVLARFKHPTQTVCRAFPSSEAAERFISRLKRADPSFPVHTARFHLPSDAAPDMAKWAAFSVVLFHESLEGVAYEFWEWFGDGISSRHAEFCLYQFLFLNSESDQSEYWTVGPESHNLSAMTLSEWIDNATSYKTAIKSRLISSARSADPAIKPIGNGDVFLCATGMAAISVIARTLARTSEDSGAVVYGWPYSGTPHCVQGCGFKRYIMYGHGSKEDLDSFESLLVSGIRFTVLFCEITSNPQLSTPDLHRIRDLANRFGFVVVCDDTIGTSVNVDILPYVDVIITSLTKIFSGAGNVMGGSIMTNPNSKHYSTLTALLSTAYEDLYFPLDAKTIAHNSSDFAARVHKCNETALQIANFLESHPAVKSVNYPTMVPTAPLYERYRRPEGGYGFLLSVIFHEPESAMLFYDKLDVWKGPTVGTNFSISIPYSALAHAKEQDWAASHAVPKHIVRLSIGLEDYRDLSERVSRALREVEMREKMS
ncbi:cystathionine beta-lyase [Talaromyces proteolyticus]|uniref:Cystathionine beta-lyase n=1 Tax=Talaromyces proteolyticus TaxID=1131652 RepID=A0AAD4KN82_9EURO|nr:cystathionine beta-lyase [Talaromyces proteolyticus]KAH8696537.1 cystathionine beta-lyase [Talaromyces proteolyticus]